LSPAITPETSVLDRRWLRWLFGIILVAAAGTLLFARTVDRDLNHDEHQFLAPAALLSREGLQPWRDYPLFHLPNLVFAYAAADRLTGDVILGAKMVCFGATALLLCGLVAAALRTSRVGIAILVAIGAVALLLGDPLFRYTAGKTWNHEVPTALLVAAVACIAASANRDRLWLTALAGICGGLATGCRLTFAPALIGLFAFVWLFPMDPRRRAVHALLLTATATLALAPSIYYLFTQREAFLFGNLEFPRLRLLDPNDTRAHETTTLWRKVRFFWKEIIRGSWAVFALLALAGIRPGWRWLRRKDSGDVTCAALLVLLPFVLLGCFAPSRYQYQHYFVFVPLVIFAVVAGIRAARGTWQVALTALALIFAALRAGSGWADYQAIKLVATRPEWFSTKAREFGKRVAAEVKAPGRVLTLAPALVLAGDLEIYPELATGAFGWRGAHHVERSRRERMHLLAPEDLEEKLSHESPDGILTGVEEPEEEEPLIIWAKAHAWRPVDLRKRRVLWLPPKS
jgi:hypothetical protein